MDLTLNLLTTERDVRLSRITSASDLSRVGLPVFVYGARLNVTVYLLDAASTYNAISGAAGQAPVLSLGRRGESALATTSDFTRITNGWTCTLDLTTNELALALASGRAGFTLSFKTVATGPNTTNWFSGDALVLGEVGDPAAGTAVTPTAYYTSAQVDALLAARLGTKVSVPATSTSTGTTNNFAYDSDYFYLCTATDTWRRFPISDWA